MKWVLRPMLCVVRRIVLVLLLAAFAAPLVLAQQPRPAARRISKRAPQPKPLPQPVVAPQQPLPPPTPEQMPPAPPQVTYQNGLLTVVAQNSTLGDILSAIRARTGAAIEQPPGAARERVATSLGPAPAREVVGALLNGSHFNYVLLSSEENPDGLQRIILLTRSAGQSTATAANQPAPAAAPPQVNADSDSSDDEETEEVGDGGYNPPTEPPALPDQTPPQPGQVQPGQVQPAQPQPGQPVAPGQAQPNPSQNPNQPQVKTPEQLLQELQRMQQEQQRQQQQQQQQQGQPPQPPTMPPTQVPPQDQPQGPPPDQSPQPGQPPPQA